MAPIKVQIAECLECEVIIYAHFQFENKERIYTVDRADAAEHAGHVLQSLKEGIIRVGT